MKNETIRQDRTVLVLGTFDGIHRGHAELIAAARKIALDGRTVELFTFSDNPKAVLTGKRIGLLMTPAEKEARARELGVDRVTTTPFTREIAAMEPEAFFERLTGDGRVSHIVVGYDYTFGRARAGDVSLLKKLTAAAHIGLTVIMPVTDEDNDVVSSTLIREAVAAGNMEKAERLLGVPYALTGTVRAGNHIGAGLGFPTANVAIPAEKLLPADGVYATFCETDGLSFPSVTNVGTAPTIRGDGQRWVECHLLGASADLYGKSVTVRFVRRLRGEKRFDSAEELRKQVETDKELAKAVLDLRRRKSGE